MIKQITKTYIICPHCNECAGNIDHLSGSNDISTMWYCGECGGRYSLEINKGNISISPFNEWTVPIAVVLKYKGAFVVVKHFLFARDERENTDDSDLEYYFNEHTCPVNWMGVECLYDAENDDIDPHGMFEYIGYELWRDEFNDYYDWSLLINKFVKEKMK